MKWVEVTTAAIQQSYIHAVRLKEATLKAIAEQGYEAVAGQDIRLQGFWKSGDQQYAAEYRGSFVRRTARLKGTQTWTYGGKTVNRTCSGAIKRPLKVFLPRNRK